MLKQIPDFENQDEEREFWAKHDSTEYIDCKQAERGIFPKLKLTTKTISLRMSKSMLNKLKLLANRLDVPFQSLIKIYLREGIDNYLRKNDAICFLQILKLQKSIHKTTLSAIIYS